MVINFIEHISMAHQLCHALFTQLELGIKRYTYWAGGQKYFYRLIYWLAHAGWGAVCVLAALGLLLPSAWRTWQIASQCPKKSESGDARRADTAGHPSSFGGTDGTTAAAPLMSVASSAADLIPGGSNPWHSAW